MRAQVICRSHARDDPALHSYRQPPPHTCPRVCVFLTHLCHALPVPLKIKFSGTLTLKDDTGTSIATVTMDGEVSP